MSLYNWITGVSIVVVCLIALYGVNHPTQTEAVREIVKEVVEVGSSGADRFNDCEARNGIIQCFYKKALSTATTSVCAFKSPAATSTLLRATLSVKTATSTATIVTIAKAANSNATTTSLFKGAIASGAPATMTKVASSSTDGADIFAPNTWLNFGVEGFAPNAADTTKFLGQCQATFELI